MAVSVKMSSKNQIVVPKEAREVLGLRPGDRLVARVRPDRVLELEREPADLPTELEGILRRADPQGDGLSLWPELPIE